MRLAISGARLPKGARIPAWVMVLQMAERWGCPPWEIAAHPGALRWITRQSFYNEQLRRVMDEDADRRARESKK